MLRPTPIRNIVSLLALALAVVAWVLFAPSALGGSASFAVIHGSSMEPLLERGELAVVRPADEYRTGDVVAYRSAQLGRTVLHRIIGRDGQRFVLKGDANDFVDFDRPQKSAVVGKLWFDVPYLGSIVSWLRSPLNLAVVAAVIAVLAVALTAGRRTHRRRGHSFGRGDLASAAQARASGVRNGLALPIAVVLLLGSLVLGGMAFSRPETQTVPQGGFFSHEGRFGYTASAPVGDVYTSSRLETGDPIFPRLVREVDFSFDYTFDSKAPASVTGSGELVAELGDGAGWRWPVTLESRRQFTGRRLTLDGRLDVAALLTEIQRFEKATDVEADTYLVTIKPEVEVQAEVAGQRFEEIYAPPLSFRLDPSRLLLETPGPNEDRRANGFIRSQPGTGEGIVLRTLSLGPLSLSVDSARTVAVVLGIVSLIGLGALALIWRRALGDDEPTRIHARYGPWLVDIEPRSRSAEPVRVAAMDGLVQLAERYDRMILHEREGDQHRYLVEDNGAVYAYEARSSAAKPAPRPRPKPALPALPFLKSLR